MAAVIRYLSADNHTADTPPFNSPETGRCRATTSLFQGPVLFKQVSSIRFCINSMISVYVLECGYVCTGIIDRLRVQRNIPALLFFHIYIYIAFTGTLQTLKTEFYASGKQHPVGHSHNPSSIITLQENPLARTTAGQKSIVLYVLLFLQPTRYQ